MGIWNDRIKELKSLPNPYALLYVIAKVLGGVGIGMLLARWLPLWTWWIFFVIACVVAVPVIWKLLKR